MRYQCATLRAPRAPRSRSSEYLLGDTIGRLQPIAIVGLLPGRMIAWISLGMQGLLVDAYVANARLSERRILLCLEGLYRVRAEQK